MSTRHVINYQSISKPRGFTEPSRAEPFRAQWKPVDPVVRDHEPEKNNKNRQKREI